MEHIGGICTAGIALGVVGILVLIVALCNVAASADRHLHE